MKTTKAFRKQIVIAIIVFICGISLMGLVYILGNKPDIYVNPGIVTAPSPVAEPVQTVRLNTPFLSRAPRHTAHYARPYSGAADQNTSSAPVWGLYMTSSAKVQSVGGGLNGTQGIISTAQQSSSRGIDYTNNNSSAPLIVTTNFMAMSASRQVAEPEAMHAPLMARLVTEPRQAPPPPGGDTDPNHQLVEQPVGEPMVLALMAIMYAIAVCWKRNPQLLRWSENYGK